MNFGKGIFKKVVKTLGNMGTHAMGEEVSKADKDMGGLVSIPKKEQAYNDDGSVKTTVTTVTKEQ